MRTVVGSVSIGVRLVLVALAAAAAMFWFGQDTQRAGASHTEVILALSPTSNVPITTIFLAIDGPPRTFYVRAENIDDPAGLGAFAATLFFEKNVTIPSTCNQDRPGNPGEGTGVCIIPDGTFLGSSGRGVSCTDQNGPSPVIIQQEDDRWRAIAECATAGISPLGPQGSGLLAEVTLQAAPGASPDTGVLDNQTALLSATAGADQIPTANHSPNIVIANCGDVIGPNQGPPDGFVTIGDIGAVVMAFGSVPGSDNWNPATDLDKNGTVVIADIGLAVLQFGQEC